MLPVSNTERPWGRITRGERILACLFHRVGLWLRFRDGLLMRDGLVVIGHPGFEPNGGAVRARCRVSSPAHNGTYALPGDRRGDGLVRMGI